jgi:hypothetical protein
VNHQRQVTRCKFGKRWPLLALGSHSIMTPTPTIITTMMVFFILNFVHKTASSSLSPSSSQPPTNFKVCGALCTWDRSTQTTYTALELREKSIEFAARGDSPLLFPTGFDQDRFRQVVCVRMKSFHMRFDVMQISPHACHECMCLHTHIIRRTHAHTHTLTHSPTCTYILPDTFFSVRIYVHSFVTLHMYKEELVEGLLILLSL